MSFEFTAEDCLGENINDVNIIKLNVNYIPDITIIEPIIKNNDFSLSIIGSNNTITHIRNIVANFTSKYDYCTFCTHDGTILRKVEKNTFIGKNGNIQGCDANSFKNIKLTENANTLLIVLDNHYVMNFVCSQTIISEFNSDLSIFKNKIEDFLSISYNNFVNIVIDHSMYMFMKEYGFNITIKEIFKNDKCTITFNESNKQHFIQKYICEMYFGIEIEVNTKGTSAELVIPNLVHSYIDNNSSSVSIAHNITRNTLTIKCLENQKSFSIYLFILNSFDKILYNDIYIIPNYILNNKYDNVNLDELKRVITFIHNVDNCNESNKSNKYKLVQDFNPSLYEFGLIPLFNNLDINNIYKYDEFIDCHTELMSLIQKLFNIFESLDKRDITNLYKLNIKQPNNYRVASTVMNFLPNNI